MKKSFLALFFVPAIVTVAAFAVARVLTFGACGALCGLHITLGFGQQSFAREFEFTGFGVAADEFNLNHIALFQAGVTHSLEAFVVDLRDVKECILTGKNLNKCTKIYDGLNLTVVGLADLGNCDDAVDGCESCIDSIFLNAEDIYNTLAILLGDGDGGTGSLLDIPLSILTPTINAGVRVKS